jgi:UDP-glucose:(heptosyl)LPS alpha-1,3-glucosyltransferase
VPEVHFHAVPAIRRSEARLRTAIHAATFARAATRMIKRDRASYDVVYALAMSTWAADIVHVSGILSGELRRERLSRDSTGVRELVRDALRPLAMPVVPVRRAIERRIFSDPIPRQIHVSSRLVRDDLLAMYDVDPERIRIVSPGFDVHDFQRPRDSRAAREEVGLADDMPVILFCGHSFERKGLDRALVGLAKMRRPAQLAVVGQGDPQPYLSLARKLGITDRVRFFGGRSDTWRFFQAADIFVLPTRVDTWGMTVLEAMASAVPPITTTGAGVADVITPGENGFVLREKPFDADVFASILDSVAFDRQLRRRIGEAAQERARTLSSERRGEVIEAAMREVAADKRAANGFPVPRAVA